MYRCVLSLPVQLLDWMTSGGYLRVPEPSHVYVVHVVWLSYIYGNSQEICKWILRFRPTRKCKKRLGAAKQQQDRQKEIISNGCTESLLSPSSWALLHVGCGSASGSVCVCVFMCVLGKKPESSRFETSRKKESYIYIF